MEADMLRATANTTLAAIAIASAIGGIIAVNSAHNGVEEVAFLERLAARVQQAQVIPPQTGDRLGRVIARYSSPLPDAHLDRKREAALERIKAAVHRSGTLPAAIAARPRPTP
jgi:hypothetical protein